MKERNGILKKYFPLLILLIIFFSSFSSFAETLPPDIRAKSLGPVGDDPIGASCSLGCALGWEIESSSHHKQQNANVYDAGNLEDGIDKTAWVEGETITFIFPEDFTRYHVSDEGVSFWGLRILNGYQKNEKVWKANSRVKKILIKHNSDPKYTVTLQDNMDIQEVHFKYFLIKPGDRVQVVILEVYPGEKYQDTALSELIPLGAH
jgi:hypothetical protein